MAAAEVSLCHEACSDPSVGRLSIRFVHGSRELNGRAEGRSEVARRAALPAQELKTHRTTSGLQLRVLSAVFRQAGPLSPQYCVGGPNPVHSIYVHGRRDELESGV